jgi:hypothetical protein
MKKPVKAIYIVAVLGLLLLTQLAIYGPNVGGGFITDDYIWIREVTNPFGVAMLRPFSITSGFYRPLISLSYGLQFWAHGMNPVPYGWFNLLLHMINIVMLFLLLSSWLNSRPYAFIITALFALNAKSNPMAVGWISGRTTLMFSFFTLLVLFVLLKLSQPQDETGLKGKTRRFFLYVSAAFFFLSAQLCKETAAATALFVFAYSYLVLRKKGSTSLKRKYTVVFTALAFIIPLVLYGILRFGSNAYTPFDAPDYYRWTLTPSIVLKNLSEYIFRAGMPELIIVVLLLIWGLVKNRKISMPVSRDKHILTGVLWFLCFILPTLYLPVRSDLYVYLPQIGLHLSLLTIIIQWSRQLGIDLKKLKTRKWVSALLAVSCVLWIGHVYTRAADQHRRGEKSFRFRKQLQQTSNSLEPGSRIIVLDIKNQNGSPSNTIAYGFRSFLELHFPGKGFTGRIVTRETAPGVQFQQQPKTYFYLYSHGEELLGPYDRSSIENFKWLQQPFRFPTRPLKKPNRRHRLKKRKERLRNTPGPGF